MNPQTSRHVHRCAFLSVMIAATTPSARAQWTVIRLHPAATTGSDAYGVGTGQQVGFARVGPTVGHTRASLWTGSAASWVNLHPAGGDYSYCYAADSGQQAGDVIIGGFDHASLWTGTAASWVDLHPAGSFSSSANGVHAGQQVGWTNIGYPRAALWTGTAASWIDLNPPPTAGYTHSSEAYAVDAGRQVGYVVDVGGVTSASLWNGTPAWINLHPAGNISSWAYGIRGAAQVGVVRVPDTSSHAALWTGSAASWVDLHPAGVLNSRASDVEGGRQVGYTVSGGISHAAIWSGTAASWVDLHAFLPAEFVSSDARSITVDSGNLIIVGWAFNNLFFREEAVMWVGAAPASCAGDFNGDNMVTSADIPGFVAALLAGGPCPASPATCPGDLNLDGIVNGADTAGFIAKMLSGGACP